MQRPTETPTLPKLPFVIANVVLLLAAWAVANRSGTPITTGTAIAITALVALAAAALCLPFLTDYASRQDAALDERQRALETLSRTTAETAEQIGIAAAGLHGITELAQKNLKSAEQLPEQLQEKMAGISRRLAAAGAAEAEKIEAAAEKISQATAELARIETALRQPRAPALPPPVANSAPKAIESPAATVKAAAKDDAKATAPAKPAAAAPVSAPTPTVELPSATVPVSDAPASAPPTAAENRAAVAAALAAADELLQDIAPEEFHTIVPFPMSMTAKPETGAPGQTPSGKRAKRAKAPGSETAAKEPAPFATVATELPLAQTIAADSSSPILALSIGDDTPLSPTGSITNEATPPPFSFARKKSAPAAPPPPPPKASEGGDPGPAGENSLSSDGATRLLVTAYIGIGNKLFIRGDGPGLRPDLGVPLQFVSIGKWRWETTDATAPLTVRLYKNDQQECAALGPVTLDPGRQRELTADF